MFKTTLCILALVTLVGLPAFAKDSLQEPPGGDYQQVSELVALPDFIPGLGRLYVDPATLPAGPFLAYDKTGKLVSSIYMIPLAQMQNEADFNGLAVGADSAVQVDSYYNAGHPGVDEPHYHFVIWHVAPGEAELE